MISELITIAPPIVMVRQYVSALLINLTHTSTTCLGGTEDLRQAHGQARETSILCIFIVQVTR